MDIHLFKNERRLGSEEVEHGSGVVGGEGGASYERWGDRKFLVISWGVGKNFSISHHEKCIRFLERGCPTTSNSPTISDYFFLQLKDIHKNNESSILDYFLPNLLIK